MVASMENSFDGEAIVQGNLIDSVTRWRAGYELNLERASAMLGSAYLTPLSIHRVGGDITDSNLGWLRIRAWKSVELFAIAAFCDAGSNVSLATSDSISRMKSPPLSHSGREWISISSTIRFSGWATTQLDATPVHRLTCTCSSFSFLFFPFFFPRFVSFFFFLYFKSLNWDRKSDEWKSR